MKRKHLFGTISIVIAVPVLVLAGFAVYLIGRANELPWQTQPTAIAVTPFANLGTPSGTTVAASTPTTAPPAATIAPVATTTPAASPATAASTAAVPGTTAAASAPAPSVTSPATTPSGTSAASAATAPSGSAAAAKAPGGATTYTIVGDQSEAKVTVNEKLSRLPTPSDAVLTTKA